MKPNDVTSRIAQYIADHNISVGQIARATKISKEKLVPGGKRLNATELLELCSFLNIHPEDFYSFAPSDAFSQRDIEGEAPGEEEVKPMTFKEKAIKEYEEALIKLALSSAMEIECIELEKKWMEYENSHPDCKQPYREGMEKIMKEAERRAKQEGKS